MLGFCRIKARIILFKLQLWTLLFMITLLALCLSMKNSFEGLCRICLSNTYSLKSTQHKLFAISVATAVHIFFFFNLARWKFPYISEWKGADSNSTTCVFTIEDSSNVRDLTDEEFLHNCNNLFKIELVANLHALKICKSCYHLLCCRVLSVHCHNLQAPASSIEQIQFSKTMWYIISLIGWCSDIIFTFLYAFISCEDCQSVSNKCSNKWAISEISACSGQE